MDYMAGIWGSKINVRGEMVQNRAIRYFLGVHKFTPILAITGDMGWEPSEVRWKGSMMALWNRLVKMPENRVAKKIFNWDVSVKGAWACEVQDIFTQIGAPDLFQNINTVYILAAKEVLLDTHKSKWSQDIFLKPKLRTYRIIKSCFGNEKYVCAPLSKKQRSLCAQLRSGVLPLHLETGRYRGVPEEERICDYCNIDIENEFHFVFYCPLYHEMRLKLFKKCKTTDLMWLNDADRLKWFFDYKVFALADYLEKAWAKRTKSTFR
jgi:hypothetical protein